MKKKKKLFVVGEAVGGRWEADVGWQHVEHPLIFHHKPRYR
jgi:hypothetical protein